VTDTPAKRRTGAPTKYSPEIAKVISEAIADGVPIKHTATLAGISFQSLCEFRRRYPEFDQQIREAFSAAIRTRLAIVKRAMESKDEAIALRAATWWLTHAPGAAEHFSESRRVELTGDGSAASVVVFLPVKNEEGGTRMVAVTTQKALTNETRNGNGDDH